jgi:hypothetical protein
MLKNLLKQRAQFFPHIEPFVLKHGHQEKRGVKLPAGFARGEFKECFSNAGRLALSHSNLTYCEGYACRDGLLIPIHHAWCLDDKDRVVDITWLDPESCSYIGVLFSHQELRLEILKNEFWGLLDAGRGPNVEFIKRIDAARRQGVNL